MKSVDFIIVGQGLAGSILAYHLIKQQQKVVIVDASFGATSSRQATGIVNPITGRRYVKSWMFDELMPEAIALYNELEQVLAINFYKKTKQIKVLQNLEQVNDFDARLQEDAYSPYLKKETEASNPYVIHQYPNGIIEPLLQVDIPLLLDALQNFFEGKLTIQRENFEHKELITNVSSFTYRNINAKFIIFAEGYKLRNNPYFSHLPIRFAKGEALIIKSETLQLNEVLNSKAHVSPQGKNQYYVGASYDWNDDQQVATAAKRKVLEEGLQQSISAAYTVIEQKVGIRPTVLDRRPLIGVHPQHPHMYVFNGMGTKGLSLVPYFAKQLLNHIFKGSSLHPEADIKRCL